MNRMFILFCLPILSQPEQSPRPTGAPPAPFGALPSPSQLRYHRQELCAFISFGLRTFSRTSKDPELFNPTALDTDQWVLTLLQAGFKRIIFPARHHDGFCLWKTATTSYSLKSSRSFQGTSEKLGQSGDVLEELSKSCTKYDIELGIYLSPWDLNSSFYGHESAYNHYFISQLTEILGNRKYGNNGTIAEVWMDSARSFDSVDQKYWWLRWFEAIENISPNTLIFSPYGSSARWIGAEDGKVGDPCWSKLNRTKHRRHYDATGEADVQALMEGDAHGDIWSVAECDVSITSGWFWRDGRVPKTMDELTEIYFHSVGRGQPLLLNIPPTPEGVIAQEFVDRVQEFG
jgi:alpha-L-fucosidase